MRKLCKKVGLDEIEKSYHLALRMFLRRIPEHAKNDPVVLILSEVIGNEVSRACQTYTQSQPEISFQLYVAQKIRCYLDGLKTLKDLGRTPDHNKVLEQVARITKSPRFNAPIPLNQKDRISS